MQKINKKIRKNEEKTFLDETSLAIDNENLKNKEPKSPTSSCKDKKPRIFSVPDLRDSIGLKKNAKFSRKIFLKAQTNPEKMHKTSLETTNHNDLKKKIEKIRRVDR